MQPGLNISASTHLLHQFRADVFDNVPDFLVFQTFERSHTGAFGTVLDDPEHLARGHVFHGCRASEVAGFRIQSRTQFTGAVAFVAMTHFAGHRLGFFGKDRLTVGGIGFPGFILAIQAGRELRVMVDSEVVTDTDSSQLSFDISQKIEKEMQYPGQIKVTVIRETRSVAFAK